MPTNRVQFQPGLSMFEFHERYGSEDKCEQALFDARWPQGFVCPRCQAGTAYAFRRGQLPYRECGHCGYQCSLIAGTMLEATKLPLTRWFMALQLISQAKTGMSALELKRQLGVSYPTAWLLKHKIMEAMRLQEAGRQLDGRVEIDDAYLGGERSGGKSGRGSQNKVPFVMAVQTTNAGEPHLVCAAQLPFRRRALQDFAEQRLLKPLTLVSDGLDCFTVAAGAHSGSIHQRHVTGGGKASVELPALSAVNTLLGNFKTAVTGTLHAFKFSKYTPRYLADFQFRFNRRYNMRLLLQRTMTALLAAPPRSLAAIRAPEVDC